MSQNATNTKNGSHDAESVDRTKLFSVHDSITEGLDLGRQSMLEMQALLEGKTVSQKLTEFLLKKVCTDKACTNAITFPAGTLIEDGTERTSCFLVLEGEGGINIRKTVHHPDYGDIELEPKTIDGPTVLGEIALFAKNARATATVELTRPTRVIELTYEELIKLLDEEKGEGEEKKEGKELETDLRKIAAERIVETIERISRAEDEFRRAANEKTRQEMRELFSFAKAKKALEATGSNTVLGSFTLTGISREGKEAEETFTVMVSKTATQERVRNAVEQRTLFGSIFRMLPRSMTHHTTYEWSTTFVAKPDHLTITVHPHSKPTAAITTIDYSDKGKKAYVTRTDSEKLGLDNMKFVGQIYREAFSSVDQIDTMFQEPNTVAYANQHQGSTTMMSPSAWGSHSSVIAARKGFVTALHSFDGYKYVEAKSYKVDKELDDILTVLRHIERVCIPQDDRVFGSAHIPLEKFAELYEGIELRHALEWSEEALKEYLAKNNEKLRPEVQKLMEMQTKRIAELWQEKATQSESLADF